MDFPKWAEEDGEKLANIIYEKLVEKGELHMNDIFNIYDTCGFHVLRKTEGVTWRILNSKSDVERIKDEKGFLTFALRWTGETWTLEQRKEHIKKCLDTASKIKRF